MHCKPCSVLGNSPTLGQPPTRTDKERAMADQIPIQVTMDIEFDDGGAYINWHAPILGHRRTPFSAPYPFADLPTVIKALDAVQYPDHPTGGPQFSADEQATLTTYGLWRDGRVAFDAYHQVGMAIY